VARLIETDGLIINIFGSIKINNMQNTASFNTGESSLTNLHSQNKTISLGQTYGDFDVINQSPVGSPIIDNDAIDNPLKSKQTEVGLED